MENAQSLPGVRKLIKKIGAATTVDVADCGVIFKVTDPGDAGYTITLPSPSAAGKGWHCKFINATPTGTLGSADVRVDAGAGLLAVHTADGGTNGLAVIGNAAHQFLDFKAASVHADWMEFWTDGSHWYAEGWSGVNTGMVSA